MYSETPIVRRGALQERELLDKLFSILLKVIHEIPKSAEKGNDEALLRARKLISETSFKAAAISGALALPVGPLGWLTILPDLAAIWRRQAQMVADIGSLFGKKGKLTEESMILLFVPPRRRAGYARPCDPCGPENRGTTGFAASR